GRQVVSELVISLRAPKRSIRSSRQPGRDSCLHLAWHSFALALALRGRIATKRPRSRLGGHVVLPSAAFARDLPEAGFGRAWAGRISPRCRLVGTNSQIFCPSTQIVAQGLTL